MKKKFIEESNEKIEMLKAQSSLIKDPSIKLRDWLHKVRLPIGDLAQLLEVSRSYVHMILQGCKIPSKNLLLKIRNMSMDRVKDFSDLVD